MGKLGGNLLLACLVVFGPLALAQGLLPRGKVSITTATGETHAFTVEIAETAPARARGLMFRERMAADAGMLFIFERTQSVAFWMRNTLIPLDMVFITEDLRVLNIRARAVPHDETPVPSAGPVRYVLEINGGLAAQLGITAGAQVAIER
jgi:uncharacterized membrane protein (UPF0127 family)